MVMQQGIVCNLQFDVGVDDVALPDGSGDELLDEWRAGHAKADVSVPIAEGLAPDDAAAALVTTLAAFIKSNPAKSGEWKAEADAKLASKDESA
tara:strand:+ start:641 stop:922 length:282 start_codon:yes stop_codon:yes gene_type:complete